MIEHLKSLLTTGDEISRNFNAGFIAGIGTALAILLALFILRIVIAVVFRRKKSSGIQMNGELGDIFISSTAITSAIMSLEQDFEAFVIQKVRIYRSRHDKVSIWVQVCFDSGSGCFRPHSEDFQKRIVSGLKEMFGIDNIDKVTISLKDKVNLNAPVKPLGMPEKTFTPDPVSDDERKENRKIPFFPEQ